MAKFKRINVRFGAKKKIAEELNTNRSIVSDALAGWFDELSDNYDLSLQIRELAKKYQ